MEVNLLDKANVTEALMIDLQAFDEFKKNFYDFKTEIISSLAVINSDLKRFAKILDGNGKDGVPVRLGNVETSLDSINKRLDNMEIIVQSIDAKMDDKVRATINDVWANLSLGIKIGILIAITLIATLGGVGASAVLKALLSL